MNKTIISMQNRQYGELFYHLREVEYSWLITSTTARMWDEHSMM
ncbi:hypothetical protein HMPREF1564_2521 [Providencia alcalifaciens R90-1475]|nr:hypothetical protein HMPREF1564_2521 [Providencia alcalifaciens R90-1475]